MEDRQHVLSVPALLGTWLALMLLTGATVAVTLIDLGSFTNLVIALGIATVKVSLVALIFMHLAYDHRFNAIVFLVSVLAVVLFVSLTYLDTDRAQRGEVGQLDATAHAYRLCAT